MDDNNQVSNDPKNQVVTDQNAQNQQSQTIQQQPETQMVVEPVSSPHKEGMPPVQDSDLIKSSEVEPELHPEVAEAGVETVSEKPGLSPDHFKAGIKHAPQISPVQTRPSGMVQLPMTKQQAQNVIKTNKKVTDSIYWLAVLVLKQIKKMKTRITTN